MKIFKIVLVILVITIVGFFAFTRSWDDSPENGQPPVISEYQEPATFNTFKDAELGIEFKYDASATGYVLEEMAPMNAKNNLEKILTLIRAEDKSKPIPEGGEWPPVISISIFTNLEKETPRVWADKNTEQSNINLKMGEVFTLTLDGKSAIRYSADGLYASENVVVLHGDKIYVITGQFIDQASEIRGDFESLLTSIRFI